MIQIVTMTQTNQISKVKRTSASHNDDNDDGESFAISGACNYRL